MKKKKKHYKCVFTTRKDFSFLLTLMLLIILFLYFFVVFIKFSQYMEAVISIGFIVVFLIMLFNNKIVLENYFIRIYFGIFIYNIKYKDIKDIYISDNHYSSLASSYHKVGIRTSKYKSKIFDTFVSPFDREDFIDEVNKRR